MAVSQVGSRVYILSAEGDTIEDRISIWKIRWVGVALTGDALILKDSAGMIYLHDVAPVDTYSLEFILKDTMSGVDVDTMDSGTLYIYVA